VDIEKCERKLRTSKNKDVFVTEQELATDYAKNHSISAEMVPVINLFKQIKLRAVLLMVWVGEDGFYVVDELNMILWLTEMESHLIISDILVISNIGHGSWVMDNITDESAVPRATQYTHMYMYVPTTYSSICPILLP
jgi:hypothetical protein